MATRSQRCKACATRTTASAGFCQWCKSQRHHGYKRIKKENLVVDQAGGAWWIWDQRGNVVVAGKPTREAAIIALGTGAVDDVDDVDDDFEPRAHAAKKKKKPASQLDREIVEALASRTRARAPAHATKAGQKRWIHKDVARAYSVPEDVVRRIYAAAQTAKRQGLYGGHYADLVERSVGRKLLGGEYTVSAMAKQHLGYDPPGGYGGPEPRGSAKAPPRPKYGDPKIDEARRVESDANRTIKEVLDRRKDVEVAGWDKWKAADERDLAILREAADEIDVAADLFEEAGAGVHAGSIRERAKQARRGDVRLLQSYAR